MTRLTARQRQILDLIKERIADRGYPPTVREIGEAVGLASPSSVHAQISALVKAGRLRRDPSKPRALVVVEEGPPPSAPLAHDAGPGRWIPLVGTIAAGDPTLAEENIEESMQLPTRLVGGGDLFMLEVKGESMTGVGILPGDLVVVRRQPTVENGEIAAVLVDEAEATVKRVRLRSEGGMELHSENPDFPPFVPEQPRILGRVVTVVRSLR
ncbi:MAG: transcriptional repressor LexA [bacterium]|nr:transcriptional repressor LexA [Acidimicrobiia bacterium]MCY4651435.1 transcriptional repressor LexA [bacterium]